MGHRVRMDREKRAKQFMPFFALKGFEEALREKERIVVSKKELSEERAEEIDRSLHQFRRNDQAAVLYFSEGRYLRAAGIVRRIDPEQKALWIGEIRISFGDIYDIRW